MEALTWILILNVALAGAIDGHYSRAPDFISFQELLKQRTRGNSIQQCPCVLHPESRQCVSYDSRYLAANYEEAILAFVDLTNHHYPSSIINSATFSCSTAECRNCFSILFHRLEELGILPSGYRSSIPVLPRPQINFGLCPRFNFIRTHVAPPVPTVVPAYVKSLVEAGLRNARSLPGGGRFRGGGSRSRNNNNNNNNNVNNNNGANNVGGGGVGTGNNRNQNNWRTDQQQSMPRQWNNPNRFVPGPKRNNEGSRPSQPPRWFQRQDQQQQQLQRVQQQRPPQPRILRPPTNIWQHQQESSKWNPAPQPWQPPQPPFQSQNPGGQGNQWNQQTSWQQPGGQWGGGINPVAVGAGLGAAGGIVGGVLGGAAGGGWNQQTTQPSFPSPSHGIGGIGFLGRKKRQAPTLGRVYTIGCTSRGETTFGEEGDLLALCGTCWTWRELPDDYFPRIVNELSCQEGDLCLSGWGQCKQQYRNIDVLRRVDGRWIPTVLSTSTCCDCRVKAGTEIHALVIGDKRL